MQDNLHLKILYVFGVWSFQIFGNKCGCYYLVFKAVVQQNKTPAWWENYLIEGWIKCQSILYQGLLRAAIFQCKHSESEEDFGAAVDKILSHLFLPYNIKSLSFCPSLPNPSKNKELFQACRRSTHVRYTDDPQLCQKFSEGTDGRQT